MTTSSPAIWEPGSDVTIPDLLDARAASAGDKVLAVVDGTPVTYAEAAETSTRVAGALADLGVGAGDCVAMLMENSSDLLFSWFGAARLGAVDVPINTAYKADFLRHQLRNSRATVVVVDAELAGRVGEVAADLPDLRSVVVRPPADPGADVIPPTLPAGVAALPIGALLAGDAAPAGPGPVWSDPSSIIYTSGTTGRSKGVVFSHNYLLATASQMGRAWRQDADDVYYAPLPLFHLAAKGAGIAAALVYGSTAVIDKRFSVRDTWNRVRAVNASCIHMLGSMLMMLWNLPGDASDASLPLRCMLAAPVPAHLHRAIEKRYGVTIATLYALSEACPLVIGGVDDALVPGTSGKVNAAMFEVRLVNGQDRDVAIGEVGEIVCRPRHPHVMFDGYFGDPAATWSRMTNLWFHTGDLGRFDEAGNLSYVDREKDALRRRGENISSLEVEESVRQHPGVAEVAAIGVPSEFTEDDVMIVVVRDPSANEPISADALFTHCVEVMPKFALPRYIRFIDALPKNPLQRVEKYRLREDPLAGEVWDREQQKGQEA